MTGSRSWSTGDTVSAADFVSFISSQVLTVFSTATARDAAITSPSEGMFSYTITTPEETLSYYDGAAWQATSLTADITGITTASNSSLAGGATSGNVTLTTDVNNTTSATATAADYVLISDTDDSNATKKALISDITALVPAGDLTGLTAGSLVDITAATGPVPTINVDLSEAATSTSDGDGDYFIVTDAASAQHKLTKANIALSGMNNDSGWTTNTGTVTSVTGTSPIASSGGTTPAISVDTTDAQFVLCAQVFSG
jgi:hypothetical protein